MQIRIKCSVSSPRYRIDIQTSDISRARYIYMYIPCIGGHMAGKIKHPNNSFPRAWRLAATIMCAPNPLPLTEDIPPWGYHSSLYRIEGFK